MVRWSRLAAVMDKRLCSRGANRRLAVIRGIGVIVVFRTGTHDALPGFCSSLFAFSIATCANIPLLSAELQCWCDGEHFRERFGRFRL